MDKTHSLRPLLAASLLVFAGASIAADKVTILSEGEAAQYWRPVADTIAVPAYPGILADKSEDVCIGVGYLLNADGSTSDFALLTAWGSKAEKSKTDDPRFTPFAQNALAAVQRWKFSSTTGKETKTKPIYTAATFAFSTTAADPAQLKGRCAIADLPNFIAKAQAESYRRRGNLNKSKLDRDRVEQPTMPVKIGL